MIKLIREISPLQRSWRNDERIYKYTRQNGLISEEEHQAWLSRIADDQTIKMFGIDSNGENVGTCGLTSINLIHGVAEFSLLIGPEFHRNGYGRLALQALLNYGFNHLRLMTIFGETFDGNPALNLFLNLGMVEEGRLRNRYFKNGKHINTIMVSMIRSEWRAQPWSTSYVPLSVH